MPILLRRTRQQFKIKKFKKQFKKKKKKNQAGKSKILKLEQEEIAPNHVQAF